MKGRDFGIRMFSSERMMVEWKSLMRDALRYRWPSYVGIVFLLVSATSRSPAAGNGKHFAANNRYVATNGSDSNDGSARHPWATVQHAANIAQPGWIIHVGPGTYNVGSGIVNNNSGLSSARIVYIGNYDKSTCTWNTKLVSYGTAVWSTDARYVEIRGFDLTSTSRVAKWGIHSGGSYLRINDNYVHDIYSDSPGAGIMVGGAGKATEVEVIGNVVAHIGHTVGGSTDNQCIYTTESHTTIVNNIVLDCHKYGIQIYSHIPGGSNHNVIANNTVIASYRGIGVGGEDAGTGPPTVDYNIIINNIVYGIRSYGFHVSGIFGSHNVTSTNLTYNNGMNYSGTYTNHTNDIVRDPLFVNYTGTVMGNYHLRAGSPAIAAGCAESTPMTDFESKSRRQTCSLGAYESQQPPTR